MKLIFSFHNLKLMKLAIRLGLSRRKVVCVDLPAGFSCRKADKCKTFSHRATGKIIDNHKRDGVRCYAASVEGRYPSVRKARWHNYTLLRSLSFNGMVEAIESSFPKDVKVIRIHSSGDFFSSQYFMAWYKVAYRNPDITMFGYTKELSYVQFLIDNPLPNFKLVYSWGGLDDKLVTVENVCKVARSLTHAKRMKLPLACYVDENDDFFRIMNGESFALEIHGNQPAGKR